MPATLKRKPTAPSPTATAFSGISNYKSAPPAGSAPALGEGESRRIARIHFDELKRFLRDYLARAPPQARASARQKLTRLTRQQFQELSTDVYDELVRRRGNDEGNQVPFLPVRAEFHPKRNQARQKLATLPAQRFEDLSSDVYYELERRYPEFLEKETPPTPYTPQSPSSTYDNESEYPSSPLPRRPSLSRSRSRSSPDRSRPTLDRDADYDTNPYSGVSSPPAAPLSASLSLRRPPHTKKPSQDPPLGAFAQRKPRPPPPPSVSSSDGGGGGKERERAARDVVVPTKSRIAEEEIEVPFGRMDLREGEGDEEEAVVSPSKEPSRGLRNGRGAKTASVDSALDSPRASGGLAALSSRLGAEDDHERERSDYFGAAPEADPEAEARMREEYEARVREEYEARVAAMQAQLDTLEREKRDEEERVRAMEREVREVQRRAEEDSRTVRALQKELEEQRASRERDAKRAREDAATMRMLRERCERLENERATGSADADVLDQLRTNMESLLGELSDLSRRYDELMSSTDADHEQIRTLDAQVREYKRLYEGAKTELRNVKATSQLYTEVPKSIGADQLPFARDGGLLDVHVTAFVASTDSLLGAARTSAPTKVLPPMRDIVTAVHALMDDLRAYETDDPDVDVDTLRERLGATLSNLVAAAKAHAEGAGMSPVSLLDAAASHVSAAVTEAGRAVRVRQATRREAEAFRAESERSGHDRSKGSLSSPVSPRARSFSRSRKMTNESSGGEVPPAAGRRERALTSESERSASSRKSDDSWAELRPYLEAQADSVVVAIQAVLSAVRSPTPPPTLSENLTQIITIVSSIVAVTQDSLPPDRKGILADLGEHANKLSAVLDKLNSGKGEVDKDARQVMAKSSFAVANAMKEMMKM